MSGARSDQEQESTKIPSKGKHAITYASEIWTLCQTNERRLSLFERKVLRCIFGAKQENETWPKRYNYDLYETFNESNIVNYIKLKDWHG